MATHHKDDVPSQGSSETDVPSGKGLNDEKTSGMKGDSADDDLDNLNYPPAWKWEKYFIGGYSPGRMIKFKKPKSMYTAINLFAGVAIMFYGYDQGVMSQVNLNPDYQRHMGIYPVEGLILKYVLKVSKSDVRQACHET